MQPQPHDVDVKALLRIAVLYNVPIACNRSTADFIISSPLMTNEYAPTVRNYEAHLQRELVADPGRKCELMSLARTAAQTLPGQRARHRPAPG